jgi:PHD/YefM family antitoxin component YafN of YafNO toxin-antitoxin module
MPRQGVLSNVTPLSSRTESCTLNYMAETTYTSLRENLASMMDRVGNDREVVIVSRKGDKKIAMILADELSGLLETARPKTPSDF